MSKFKNIKFNKDQTPKEVSQEVKVQPSPEIDAETAEFIEKHMAQIEDTAFSYLITDLESVDHEREDGFRVTTVRDFTRQNEVLDGQEIDGLNYWYGWSLSLRPEHEQKLVVAIYCPSMIDQIEEVVFELVPHETDSEGLVLLSSYGPEEAEIAARTELLMEYINIFNNGSFKNVYLANGIKLIDNMGSNQNIIEAMKADELSDEQVDLLTSFMSEYAASSYFPMRDLMLMVNSLDAKLSSMSHTKIVQAQLTTMFELANNTMNGRDSNEQE